MKRIRTALPFLLLLMACRQRDVTLAADAVIREYPRPYDVAWQAARDTLALYPLTVKSENYEEGEILAVDADGDVATVLITKPAKILVHLQPGDVDWARAFHERLAENLNLGEADGVALRAEYPVGLEACFHAARHAFKVCDLLITKETPTRIEGRRADSVPVRISMVPRPGGTEVTFVVGSEWNEEYKELVSRLKRAFSDSLSVGGSPGR